MTRRRRIVVTRTGGPEVLRVDTDDAPEPGPDHLRIRVTAAGIARADLLMRAGRYPGRAPAPPFTPGWDVTGVVDAVGPKNVQARWRGRRVVALTLTGGHASQVCAPASSVVEFPDTLPEYAAACLPLTHVTAHELLHHVARVRPGEQVLVHGAAGGVGTALLDVGHLLGAEMYGVAAPRDHALVEEHGAQPVERGREAFTQADIVLDMIGGATLRASWRSLRPGGRLISYGFLSTEASPPGTCSAYACGTPCRTADVPRSTGSARTRAGTPTASAPRWKASSKRSARAGCTPGSARAPHSTSRPKGRASPTTRPSAGRSYSCPARSAGPSR